MPPLNSLQLSTEIAQNYTSLSQKIRVMTEQWVSNAMFCPNCGGCFYRFENNTPVADFYCRRCSEEYELKSKKGALGIKIVDGAYATMIERLNSKNNPNFLFLTYEKRNFQVRNFLAIPKYFFTDDIIEKRNPLGPTARRAGWIGCNIAMSFIPEFGKVFYVKNGVRSSKEKVLNQWKKTVFVKENDKKAKGWLFDISLCVEKLQKREFSLSEVYAFETELKGRHPENNNIKAKIRQQLQILRDKGFIEFVSAGQYKVKTENS